MLDIKQLRQKRHDSKVAMEALNNDSAATGMNAEQQAQFDAYLAIVTQCNADIKRAEALLDMQRSEPAAAGTSVGHNNEQDRPWASLSEQLTAIREHAVTHGRATDPRLFASLGANETIDTEGGWEVAPEFSATLVQRTFQDPDILSRCDVMPMSSSILRMNGLADNDRSTAAGRFAGIQVYRLDEGQPYTASKLKYRRIELNAKKLGALFYATEELLADAPAIQDRVNKLVPQALTYQLTDEVFGGNGTTQFLGVETSGAQAIVLKDNNQATGTISTANVDNMWNALHVPSRRNACWFIQQDNETLLDNLTRGSGTAVELIYTPAGEKGNNTPYGLLKGRPVIPVEQAAPSGVQGDMMLWDLSQYLIGDRQTMRFDSSMHVAFVTARWPSGGCCATMGSPIGISPSRRATARSFARPLSRWPRAPSVLAC